jgi:rubrerythrin
VTENEPEPYTGDIMVVCNRCSHEWVLDLNHPVCPGCGAIEDYSEWDENGER